MTTKPRLGRMGGICEPKINACVFYLYTARRVWTSLVSMTLNVQWGAHGGQTLYICHKPALASCGNLNAGLELDLYAKRRTKGIFFSYCYYCCGFASDTLLNAMSNSKSY
jgi:hypothetical protein